MLNGMTFFKALGVGIKLDNGAPKDNLKKEWQAKKLFVIDEISLGKAGGIGVIDERLHCLPERVVIECGS